LAKSLGERKEQVLGKMSREKGKRYEREIASFLRSHGYDCRRGQQYCGASGDADVVGLPGIHIECKHVEKMSLYDWMDQSVRDAKKEELPAVFHRKNNCETLVTMRADDWMQLYKEYEAGVRDEG
jgi:Holliday junction resolvase